MRTRQVLSSGNSMSSRGEHSAERHQTVLLHEAIDALNLSKESVVLDATFGSGGHARAIIARLGSSGCYIGMDADESAIAAGKALAESAENKPRTILIHENFRHLKRALATEGVTTVDAALFDLGWRIEQMEGSRGFSFREDGPLLMTYDQHPPANALTAREIVNTWEEASLADIIYGWGGERFARRIARAIVERRAERPIERTQDLAELVTAEIPGRAVRSGIHPATKTFQALRIAVNDEIGALNAGLADALDTLAPGGRVAVISFHSTEDRLVKRFFLDSEKAARGFRVSKKPLAPLAEEVRRNPRARSAKLRTFQKN